jgi:hypothetical protein
MPGTSGFPLETEIERDYLAPYLLISATVAMLHCPNLHIIETHLHRSPTSAYILLRWSVYPLYRDFPRSVLCQALPLRLRAGSIWIAELASVFFHLPLHTWM